jgi:hypothetical protein
MFRRLLALELGTKTVKDRLTILGAGTACLSIADFTRVVEQTQREPPTDKSATAGSLMPSSYGRLSRAPAEERNGEMVVGEGAPAQWRLVSL